MSIVDTICVSIMTKIPSPNAPKWTNVCRYLTCLQFIACSHFLAWEPMPRTSSQIDVAKSQFPDSKPFCSYYSTLEAAAIVANIAKHLTCIQSSVNYLQNFMLKNNASINKVRC